MAEVHSSFSPSMVFSAPRRTHAFLMEKMRGCSPLWCYFNCEAYIIPHLASWGVPMRQTLHSEVISQNSSFHYACLNISKSCPLFCPTLLPLSYRSAHSPPCVQSDQLSSKSGRSLLFQSQMLLFFPNPYQCT